jgi:hypothetical protein
LKPGPRRVYSTFDCCESGNIGESFKLLSECNSVNRWIEPPPDAHRDVQPLIQVKYNPKQCWTIAGCTENGTCADEHDATPHGLFNRTLNETVRANPTLKLSALATKINAQMGGQTCVPNGPEWAFLEEPTV